MQSLAITKKSVTSSFLSYDGKYLERAEFLYSSYPKWAGFISASFRLLKTTSCNRWRGGHRTVGWRGSWPFIAAWWWAGAIAHFLSMRDKYLKMPPTLPPLSRGRLAARRPKS
jgi:hypothetical protein